jgi:site-specific recombinase XerD
MRNQRRNASPPNTVNCTVRKYLTAREIEKLMDYARKHSRYGHRDATMILVTYRHGLRASEVCELQWHQVELDHGRMHVRRAKNGTPSVHPIRGDEIRALRKVRRESPKEAYVFVTERGGPMSTIGFHHLIQRLGKAARMPFPPCPAIAQTQPLAARRSSPSHLPTRGARDGRQSNLARSRGTCRVKARCIARCAGCSCGRDSAARLGYRARR